MALSSHWRDVFAGLSAPRIHLVRTTAVSANFIGFLGQ